MNNIWTVYREYRDWDEHEKDNVRAFTTEAQATVWCENANILHQRWVKTCNKVKSKKRQEDKLSEVLTETEDILLLEKLCAMMPEYGKRNSIDPRYKYKTEQIQVEIP